MASIITAALAACLGILCYLLIPVGAMSAPVTLRQQIGRFYLKLAARCFKQFTFVRRVLGGYDVKVIKVDEEQKLLKNILTSNILEDDNEYPFKDPDNRILRLFNKPVALCFEGIPAAVDAELAEIGFWTHRKDDRDGLWSGDLGEPDSVRYDPYVPMADDWRLVDPIDVFEITTNDVDPENVKTAEQLTKKRFEKYGSGLGLRQSVRVLLGFAVGVGGVLTVQYVNRQLLDGSGGGIGISNPVGNETLAMGAQTAVDVAVVLG